MSQIHIVDVDQTDSLRLLEKAYKTVYCPAVIPADREPLEDWIENLRGNNDVVAMTIIVAGDGLDSDDPEVKGITTGFHYKGQDANLIAYTVVDPTIASEEYGQIQLEMLLQTTRNLRVLAHENGSKADSAFIELPADDAEGLKNFQALGARVLNFNYVSPPYTEAGAKNRNLKLAAFEGDSGLPTTKDAKNFVRAIYTGLSDYLPGPVQDDPDYRRMMQEIDVSKDFYGLQKTNAAKPGPGSRPGM